VSFSRQFFGARGLCTTCAKMVVSQPSGCTESHDSRWVARCCHSRRARRQGQFSPLFLHTLPIRRPTRPKLRAAATRIDSAAEAEHIDSLVTLSSNDQPASPPATAPESCIKRKCVMDARPGIRRASDRRSRWHAMLVRSLHAIAASFQERHPARRECRTGWKRTRFGRKRQGIGPVFDLWLRTGPSGPVCSAERERPIERGQASTAFSNSRRPASDVFCISNETIVTPPTSSVRVKRSNFRQIFAT